MGAVNSKIEMINQLLPQTQCGLCGYKGCRPYAEAIVQQQANIDLCLPGGIDTLKALGTTLQQDTTPYLEEMQKKTVPNQRVEIQDATCIGCTKCIQACPVDAIVGAAKQLHTVISDICTGCGLCLPPCPVDCIEVMILPELNPREKQEKAKKARHYFEARETRLKNNLFLKPDKLSVSKKTEVEKISLESVKAAVKRVEDRRGTQKEG